MSVAHFRCRLIPALVMIFLSGVYCNICPHNCVCSVHRHRCASTTDENEITSYLYEFYMDIGCKDRTFNVNCFDLPLTSRQFPRLNIYNCHSSILACIHNPHRLNQAGIKVLFMNQIHGTLRKEQFKDLKLLEKIEFILDDDAPVPVTLFNSLKNIASVRIFKGKLQLSSDKFNSTSLLGLQIFFTSMDHLHSGAFEGLPNLKDLELDFVRIEHISEGFLSGLHSLQYLSLGNNNLTSIAVGAFTNTPDLRYLVIFGNPLVSIPDQLMVKLKFLQVLDIERHVMYLNDEALKIGHDAFAQLHALENVTIRHCTLHKRYEDSENSTDITVTSSSENRSDDISPIILTNVNSLKSAIISDNCIAEISNVMFGNKTTLENLNMSNNMIKELPKHYFNSFSALMYLDLSQNNIKELQDGLFSNLMALQTLRLSNNAIEMLTFDVFIGLENLTELYLQKNKIMTIEYDDYGHQTPFRHLSNLKLNDLSYNKISIYSFLATEMPHMQDLNVSNNDIEDIRGPQSFYGKNIMIDLSKNKISYAGLRSTILQPSNDSSVSNCVINIEHNPFICNCHNYGLYLRSKGIAEKDEPQFVVGNSTCSGPPNLNGKIINELSPTDITCVVKGYGCPDNCTCTMIPVTHAVVIDCNEMPTKLEFRNQRPLFYTLKLKSHPHSLLKNIRTLNLSNIDLRKIEFNVTDHLEVLDVSHNNLTTIPNTFLNTNITLYVADNPLECDCPLVQGLKEDRVADYGLVHCADGTELSEINVTRLCMWKTLLMGHICMGIIAGIFLFKCGLSTYRDMKRKRMKITTFLFRRGSDYSINMEMVHDITKDNDLFISFAHEDSEFVRDHLLPKLENDFNQKVCVHHRDWVPGELIEDQIVQSVESSRRTMIILTEAFILSEWSYLEFRTAHNMSIREGRPRIIIVLLEESIVNDKRLSKEIKSYTSVNTYLVWGDPNFWQKLKRILPKRHG